MVLYYGRLGFMPLDNSIIFDGGWRILSGQIPFRDFVTPAGLIPMILQAGFFKLLGVNWFSYCMHSAVSNGLFCIMVFFLLKSFSDSTIICFFFSLLSGVIFYTPIGVPHIEQHSFFFVLLALITSLKAAECRKRYISGLLWMLIPLILILSYLSKQIPAVFAVPLIGWVIVIKGKGRIINIIKFLAIGCLSASVILILLIKINDLNIENIILYSWELPSKTLDGRIAAFFDIQAIKENLAILVGIIRFESGIFLASIPFFSIIAIAGLYLLIFSRINDRMGKSSEISKQYYFEFILSVILFFICFFFIAFTHNQRVNGLPYLFISIGILYIIINKLSLQYSSIAKINLRIFSKIFITVALLDAVIFSFKVNATRLANDIIYDQQKAMTNSQYLPTELSFLSWHTPVDYNFTAENFFDIYTFFQKHKGNFLYYGDASILYGITGRPSVFPSVWIHPGLTFPEKGSEEFPKFENELMKNMKKYNVKYVIEEGEETWMESKISDFTSLNILLNNNKDRIFKIGSFKIIEINDML
jgi:hypothetical protein